METVEAVLADRPLTETEREATRRARIVARVRRGDPSALDLAWPQERAARLSDN